MTKAELIRKLSKLSGVPDSEAKIFFEIFLKRVSKLLKPGEAIFLRQIGYFQLRRGMIKNIPLFKRKGNENVIYADLIIYYQENKKSEAPQENLIFNVPSENFNEYDLLDSYFSLSIGKPLIPLQGIKPTEFFIPPTGNKLLKLIETKVEKLLRESKVIDQHVKGNEILLIDANNKNSNQLKIAWDNSTGNERNELEQKNQSDDNLSEYENVSWDFGEDLSNQIEEESILDIDKEPITFSQLEEDIPGLSWNFGDETDNESHVDKSNEPVEAEEEQFDNNLLNDDVNNVERDELTTQEFEDRADKGLNNFKKVKSLTSEILHSSTDDNISKKSLLSWDLNSFAPDQKTTNVSNPFLNNEEEIVDERGFKKVRKTTTHNFELDEPIGEESLSPDEDKITNDNIAINKHNVENKPENFKEIDEPYYGRFAEGLKSRERHYSKNRSTFVFLIALGTILLVTAALYLFIKNGNYLIFQSRNKIEKPVYTAVTAGIIDREFAIPVTYPYLKKGMGHVPNAVIKPSLFKFNQSEMTAEQKHSNLYRILTNSKVTEKKANTSTKKNVTQVPVITEFNLKNYIKVKDNIYKKGNYFIVQVSSWRSKSVAVKQANRYTKGGLKSFIEKAKIPGRGTWYRVRVGNFNSLKIAESFIKKNK